jgi:hypothetical protein
MTKEFTGSAHNEFLIVGDNGTLIPSAEVILMLSEPSFSYAPGGGMVQSRVMSEVRFAACSARLRNLAKALDEVADSLDAHALNYGRLDKPA